ncbi:MAG: 3-deoxy-8-phosphooctulonate synthase [Thermodesulfobacteriota bacterium]
MTLVSLAGRLTVGAGQPLLVIAGPCVLEDEALARDIALTLRDLTAQRGVSFIFKASWDKANRTSAQAYRGPGLKKGLAILARLKADLDLPVTSDVHEPAQVPAAADVLDVIQIPAFLCRQTDLLLAAAASGRVVNVKKGQFLAPWDMRHVVAKLAAGRCDRIFLTERGSSFGYNNLVVDMRGLAIMADLGWPVIFDATHAVQLPGAGDGCSAGERRHVAALSRAAVAAGVDGVFFEVHPDPDRARCDGPNSLPLAEVGPLLDRLLAIRRAVQEELR